MHTAWRHGLEVIKDASRHFGRHRCESLGAALAFKTLLALAPLLVVAVAVIGFVVGGGQAGEAVIRTARQTAGPRGAEVVSHWLASARSFGTAATAIGIVLVVWGASRLVATLDVAMRVVFDPESAATQQPPRVTVVRKILRRLVAIGWTLVLGAWIAASILARVALAYVMPHHAVLVVARTLLGFASLTLAVALAYRMLPRSDLSLRQALQGAAITSTLVMLGTLLLELWFHNVKLASGYGATGGLVVFLLWLYAAAQLFLFGAEVSAAMVRRASGA